MCGGPGALLIESRAHVQRGLIPRKSPGTQDVGQCTVSLPGAGARVKTDDWNVSPHDTEDLDQVQEGDNQGLGEAV